ncbi:hypothetical protein [Frigidibacter sp.]|uniref:hypothetical protein n=1 Tax=Frigidibacter sp. TaxID=2586418 RepID=UPI002732FDED|nr:hypothetical protein [Frigidibacter sp.]MDP3338717.1 hypothetical protein [Frigidibacter sp.]
MNDIPDDLSPVLREIDDKLKLEGVPPHMRAVRAVKEFSVRFGVKSYVLDLAPVKPGEVIPKTDYPKRIHAWFREVYGKRLPMQRSAKVAVFAHGDLWEMLIPFSYGRVSIDPCDCLTHVTGARLAFFTDADRREAYRQFALGHGVRAAFDRFRKLNQSFIEAETDWTTAVALLTAQTPNFGQSRWASLQMCEKFMKGLIVLLGVGNPRHGHDLEKLHGELAKSIEGLDLNQLIAEVECRPEVRYGETLSTRDQAYAAHKAGLQLIHALAALPPPAVGP